MYVLIYTDLNGRAALTIMKEYIGGFSLYINYLLNSPIKKHPSRQCVEKLWIMNIAKVKILKKTPEEHIKELGDVVYYIY
jgi:hypothetical protein